VSGYVGVVVFEEAHDLGYVLEIWTLGGGALELGRNAHALIVYCCHIGA